MFDARLVDIELVYQDETGSRGSCTMHLPIGTTYADADIIATALVSVLASLTSCTLMTQRIKYKYVASTRDEADTSSRITHAGAFFFSNGDDVPMTIIVVPGILDTLLMTSGPTAGYEIDKANIDVDTFVTQINDGIYTNPYADDVIQLEAAYLQSRI